MKLRVAFILLGFVAICCNEVSAEDREQDRAAIEKSIGSYVAAFNSRDASALASHWSPDGVYISRLTGEQVTGREDLTNEFGNLFKEVEQIKLDVNTESIQFVSPSVALEQGTASVMRPDSDPTETSYSVVHIKRDGKWLIDRVSEEELQVVQSNHEYLKDLEFLIGNWVDEQGGEVVTTDCSWTRNQNFMTRSFVVAVEDQIDIAGMQVVGWDSAQERIRSWVFDSDGGFAEGEWRKHNDRWIVQSTATLPDGRRGSATSILRQIDENRIGWQKINRLLDGEILPNIEEIVIVRQE